MNRAALALGSAAALVGWNNAILPRLGLGPRGRAGANGAMAVGLSVAAVAGGVSAAELGWVSVGSGLRVGAVAASVPAAAYPAALMVPAARARMGAGARRADLTEWVFVHIPFGTVFAEELAFRSVLYALARRAFPRGAAALGAVAFGLWHVRPARDAGDSVLGTVAFTALSSLLFDFLRARSGSVIAPALLHLSVNVGGAAAADLAAGRLAR
ncbi:CPBP family intramembrane metalloprotease [Rhodococcus spelaei]|uniref:CPBP family intramembrane metalloprotease n=1 Tax=Rhodococcus spelaei TaxID=2546320 RepID=A0A541BPK8_9NOCA|nr:CPBP family intramembrane glutamic endopeptidase [Rhodococcus spelaei]TQF74267.1 CPBP family intramembrane metalloprotease [Rhodococcus spelaei]